MVPERLFQAISVLDIMYMIHVFQQYNYENINLLSVKYICREQHCIIYKNIDN